MGSVFTPSRMKLVGAVFLFGGAFGLSAIHDEQWISWKRDFGVSYPPSEDLRRYAIFQDNLEFISEHNSRYDQGLETYTVALNRFAAMDQPEFSGRYQRRIWRKRDRTRVPVPRGFSRRRQCSPSLTQLHTDQKQRRPRDIGQGYEQLRFASW